MLVKLLTLAPAAERMRRHRAAARAFASADGDAAETITVVIRRPGHTGTAGPDPRDDPPQRCLGRYRAGIGQRAVRLHLRRQALPLTRPRSARPRASGGCGPRPIGEDAAPTGPRPFWAGVTRWHTYRTKAALLGLTSPNCAPARVLGRSSRLAREFG